MTKKRDTEAGGKFPCTHCRRRLSAVDLSRHVDEEPCRGALRAKRGALFTTSPRADRASAAQKRARRSLAVWRDAGGGICLELRRRHDVVEFITQTSGCLTVERLPAPQFDRGHAPVDGSPVERAAVFLAECARVVGATVGVVDELQRVLSLWGSDRRVALTRYQEVEKKKTKKKKTKRARKKKVG